MNIETKIEKLQVLIDRLKLKQNQYILELIGESRETDTIISSNKIMSVVFRVLKVNANDVFKKHKSTGKVNRVRTNVFAKYAYYYFCKKYSPASLKQIGRIKIGDGINVTYDHSTVIYGVREWGNLIETDKTYRAASEKIDSILSLLNVSNKRHFI